MTATTDHLVELDGPYTLAVEGGRIRRVCRDGVPLGPDLTASFDEYARQVVRRGAVPRVIKAKVLVTGACNQRCFHCYAAAEYAKAGLDTAGLVRVFGRLHDGGVRVVQLHGGDLSVRRDLADLLAALDRLDLFAEFFTNGTGGAWKREETFAAVGRMRYRPVVAVSLLGGTAARHDRLTGLPGAFKQALATAHRLRGLGCPVTLAVTLTAGAAGEVGKLRTLAAALGAALSVNAEVFSATGGAIDTLPFEATPAEILSARRELFGDAEVDRVEKTCASGVLSLTVDHDGYVVGCERNTTRRFGSLLETPLRPILESAEYREYTEAFYRRPAACDACPAELRRHCNWCPATPFNYGIPQAGWVDWHCATAMRRRLFWAGRADPVPGSRPAAVGALTLPSCSADTGCRVGLPVIIPD